MSELSHKYLRVQDLARLRNLLFASRRPVAGRYAGRHVSPQRGHSVEFTDYRQYTAGDEIGDIDWKVYARSDRLFVKLFEHQSDMTAHLLVDASASMDYRGVQSSQFKSSKLVRRPSTTLNFEPGDLSSKYDHACRMAAAIAFLTTRQQDRISFGVAREGLAEFLPSQGSPSHLRAVLKAMERTQPGGRASLAEAVAELASRVPRRGLLIVFSDLLDDPAPLMQAMSHFPHRGGEVIVFHILHADELSLPPLGDAVFADSETGQRLSLNVPDVREAYEQRLKHFLEGWATGCRGRGFDYQLVNTARPYCQALENFLFTRAGGTVHG
jgi:uncharacterized protein (DUF58 family)